MIKKKQPLSPAIQLLDLVWRNQGHGQGQSWERLNHAMSEALGLAVRYGLRFDLDDFGLIERRFNFTRWAGVDGHMMGERFYSLACGNERGRANMSAALAFEKWVGRKPFLVGNRDNGSRTRVHKGCRFEWYGEMLEVTSFNEDGTRFVACGYVDGKLAKRVAITHADIQAFHRAIKAQKTARKACGGLSGEAHAALAERWQSEFGKRGWKSLYKHEAERVLVWLGEKAQAGA